MTLEGDKIVTAAEMARVEKLAYADGHSDDLFMQKAGEAVAEAVCEVIEKNKCAPTVVLLIGKGNNGGDAYVAGVHLLKRGISTSAYHLFPLDQCSPLCKKNSDLFQKAGGHIHFVSIASDFAFPKSGVIVDGLVGTGFHGKAEGELAEAILAANKSGLPLLAVDIPSGVNGDTGVVASIAIKATLTIYLGLPKLGFFLRQGYDHIGELVHADFGLPQKYIEAAHAEGFLVQRQALQEILPPTKRTQHKYSRGYVLGMAGSPGMTGAAFMSSAAAMRAGAGIVRLFHPHSIEEELVNAPWELIHEPLDFQDISPILREAKRAGSLFFGPGMGKESGVAQLLEKILEEVQLPLVIDADGLVALSKIKPRRFPAQCIVTPHRGELKTLLGQQEIEEEELLKKAQQYVDERGVTLIYKGAPTWVFHPKVAPLVLPVGDPGMATAGSGDVLTGVLAAILAKGVSAREAATLGVFLHGAAGKIAAREHSSSGMIATDIIAALPEALMLP